ncbi:ComEC/Rec2 family competence protein [Sulfurospirillum arcachonense]|uniref:ComEC/Rec2 family competence protein n=1 Tax=Sulfurospirillum arcachonense TaxID=57666 RepID=UPI000468ECFD|nr:ComEC/Rec2 family competence protein [Sulfurospirillum arcachonense]
MTSVPLFITKKEFFYTLFVVALLFFSSLSYEFYKYKKVTTYSLHVTDAKVLKYYPKKNKNDKVYHVLKLKSQDFTFYTVSWKDRNLTRGDTVKIGFFTNKIDFINYLKGFYATTKFLHVKNKYKQNSLISFVENQHKNELAKELYSALYFATPISKKLRENISQWGIAHLVAISGFHLGILSGILFFLLKPLYTFFQDKYFPYRNSYADLAFIVFVILGTYTYFIDMTPSVLRAYVMSIIGFLLFSRNIKIISFGTLFITVCAILILFPKLMFSIAFLFSVAGVFYIFLFLYHFSGLNKALVFILLHFWVYLLMLPIVHYVFDVFSLYQLFSPLLSMFFIVFYPLSLALHVIQFGDIFDHFLSWFFSLHVEVNSISTPFWFLGCYIVSSLVAIRVRLIAIFLPLLALILFFI